MKNSSLVDNQMIKEIFWDRPEMTSQMADKILNQGSGEKYYWFLARLVERLPSNQLLELIGRDRLYAVFPKLRIWKKISFDKARELFPDKYQVN